MKTITCCTGPVSLQDLEMVALPRHMGTPRPHRGMLAPLGLLDPPGVANNTSMLVPCKPSPAVLIPGPRRFGDSWWHCCGTRDPPHPRRTPCVPPPPSPGEHTALQKLFFLLYFQTRGHSPAPIRQAHGEESDGSDAPRGGGLAHGALPQGAGSGNSPQYPPSGGGTARARGGYMTS